MSGNTQERNGDIALLLYATPFIINFVYAMYLWIGTGLSAILPQLVYLEVTQSPYIFLIGFAAVCGACIIDFDASTPETRRASIISLSRTLQAIAALAIILALITALYAGDFNPINAFTNLIGGIYPLVFPALLLLFSFVMLPSVKLQGVNWRNVLVVVLLIASPAALYELGKRNTSAGLGVGLILILAAAYLLVRPKKE